MVNILLYLALCIGSAILYRLGGSKKGLTKWRDLGCPTFALFALWHLFGFHWVYLLVFGLMFGALTTYYDTIFGYDNFTMHGFGIGLATLPLLWVDIHWWAILAYALVLGLSMGFVSLKLRNPAKELCRGGLIVALLPVLLI